MVQRAGVYVDGYNVYYGVVRDTTSSACSRGYFPRSRSIASSTSRRE